jgi:hypothetical protein
LAACSLLGLPAQTPEKLANGFLTGTEASGYFTLTHTIGFEFRNLLFARIG